MPKISDTIDGKKSFKPKKYRAWDNQNETEQIDLDKDQTIHSLNPETITRWKYKDRPENELGDIDSLANEFMQIGQQQPCVVREVNDSESNGAIYELLIGERRWMAAKKAKIQLKVIIKDYSNEQAALAQAAENDNRKDLSEYAKGISFSRLIEDKIIAQKDLIDRLGKSKQYVSALLSFSKIPENIKLSIEDFSHVSSRTSETIVRLSKKGNNFIEAIISLSDGIRSGKLGANSIERKVLKIINVDKSSESEKEKVFSRDGRHIFTWRSDNNSLPSIHFPKQIYNLFKEEKIDLGEFTVDIVKLVEDKLKKI